MTEGENRPPDGPESDRPSWEPPTPAGPPPPPFQEPPPHQQPPRPEQVPPGYPQPPYPPYPPPPYAAQPRWPEGTWSGHRLADWWARVGATLLDALIVGMPIVVVIIAIDPALGVLLGLTVSLTYYPLLMMREGTANGQTLGKQMVGIRVVQESGQPFGYGAAVMREFVIKNLLFGTAGGFFLGVPTLLDYLWPLWDRENRALHDMLASSRVVQA